jgi:Bacterial PH domain
VRRVPGPGWHDGGVVESVRPWWGRALTLAIAAICFGLTIWTGIGDSWSDAALTAPWTALLTLTCWATFWRPRVAVSDAGVQLVNVTRTIFIPWPALEAIDTKWALTLVTAYGRFKAWSAPAPGTRGALMSLSGSRREYDPRHRQPEEVVRPGDLIDSPSGSAAALIHRRWDEVRAAGHLENPRLEHDRAPVTWHIATGVAVLGLLAVGVVTFV